MHSARRVRQYLSADSLFQLVRSRLDEVSDLRSDQVEIPLGDALKTAFAMFSLKDPSLHAFDERRRDPNDNFRTIYGIEHVPCDSQMRSILDPLDPVVLRPLFQDVFRRLQRGQELEQFVYLDGHYLPSLDGTSYFSSSKIHCPKFTAPRVWRSSSVADALSSNAPHLDDLREAQAHSIIGVKPGDHAFLFRLLAENDAVARTQTLTLVDEATGVLLHFRFHNGVPLNESHQDCLVNVLEYWEVDPAQDWRILFP